MFQLLAIVMLLTSISQTHERKRTGEPLPNSPHASSLAGPASPGTPAPQQTLPTKELPQIAKSRSDSYLKRLFAPENVPNLALFLVGLPGVVLAYRTVRASEKSAAAALLNAQAVINAERAWITVSPHVGSPEFYPTREKNAPMPDNLVEVLPIAHLFAGKLVNVGKTPATIEAVAVRYVLSATHPSEWNPTPDYGQVTEQPLVIFPNEVNTISAELSPTATLTKAQIERIEDEKDFLYAFGFVKYRDVYKHLHETRFGFHYQVRARHLVMKDGVIQTIRTGDARFRASCPSAYNRHT